MFARVSGRFFFLLSFDKKKVINTVFKSDRRSGFLSPFFTRRRFREGMITGYNKRSFVQNQIGYHSASYRTQTENGKPVLFAVLTR